MGLEPTTFCMASSTRSLDFQHLCGVHAGSDAIGLHPITVGSGTEEVPAPNTIGLRFPPGFGQSLDGQTGSAVSTSECVHSVARRSEAGACSVSDGALASRPERACAADGPRRLLRQQS